ncbi:hypothetical protein [Streptomyces sp. F001]|uniref:AMP-binding enzyme n=1 Tax=Streptomyces sp. F001 TaxID=1510026 RepID=UPI0019CF5F50|nr:hypothetical protein [Streptomyces sp. F001]
MENLLSGLPAVAEVAVVPDPTPDRRAGVRVRGDPAGERPDAFTGQRAPHHARGGDPEVPGELFLVDALPRTPSGKIKKFALRDWLRDRDTAVPG